ncbi:beta strand repeat-containing protein [Tardiphaga sp. 866_E4_N2_1]|uniref:beta strand repeat-containing protein n=1 Tax=unclassified Tardiphaga TaxID=2631404 RepID=UPI003F1F1F6B
MPSGTTLNVTPAGAVGLSASNAGQITANGITENLTAATTTGALAQSGSRIIFDGSTLRTTATTTATSASEIGLRATGSGSRIDATGSSITMGPPNGTTTASNMTGAIAEAGTAITLTNTFLQMLGGGNGLNNRGIVATGLGSTIGISGGGVSTASRGAIAVMAEGGGIINIGNAAAISTTGVQNTVGPIGSHGLFATGSGSQMVGSDISISTSGLLASAARAENGGSIFLMATAINTSSTASADTDPSSAARVLSGGFIELRNSTITTTGQRGNGISVQDAESIASVFDTTISVSGTRAPAALIFNGGTAQFTNSSLFSANNTGVLVQDAGSTATFIDSTIRSTAAVGYGLRVNAGGSAEMSGGSVTTEGRDGPAFAATNGSIVANNVTIVTRGPDNAMGALADLGGNITLNGGSVTTFGDSVRLSAYPHGLAARNPGGILMANGTSVLTQGLVAMGAVADDGGTMILNGNSIRTLGTSSIGLYATVEQAGLQFPATLNGSGISVETFGELAHGAVSVQHFLVAPSVITLDNSSITTHGNLSAGLRAITAGTVNANRTSVLTEGLGSNGLHARDLGSSVNISATSVLTTGNVGNGGVAEGGGLLTGINSAVRATGANAMGLYVAGAPGQVSNANFTGSSITNIDGPTIGVGGNGNVSLTNSSVSGSGQWLRVGTIANFSPLSAPDSGPPGITDPEGTEIPIIFPPPAALPVVPGLANVTLSRTTVIGSAFTAPGSASNVTLLDNSTWIMTGSSNVTNLVNDPSLIQFTPPTGDASLLSSYKTLTTVN